ncbi:hypothetical protein H4Q26_015658 [Puccinia striiformis f. sp. tritici PST-130]|nr:hypothetical protein H4Q26_015658 [Puccinia striiformis f. sp. tritici PST-130]
MERRRFKPDNLHADESQIRLHGEIRNSSEAQLSDIGFMAWGPKDSNNPSGWPRRFRENLEAEEGCPVYKVPAIDADPVEFGPVKSFIPSLGGSQRGCRPIALEKWLHVWFCHLTISYAQIPSSLVRWLNNTKTVEIEPSWYLSLPMRIF